MLASHAQLGNNTGSCQPRVNPKVGETGTVHNQDASMDMPLENIVHIEDVSRTTFWHPFFWHATESQCLCV